MTRNPRWLDSAFAELRRQMEEARRKAEEEARKAQAKEKAPERDASAKGEHCCYCGTY